MNKIKKEQIMILLYILIMAISIIKIPMLIQFTIIVLLIMIISLLNNLKITMKNYQWKIFFCIIFVLFLFLLTVLHNNISISNLSDSFITITVIYIFLLLLLCKDSFYKNTDNYLKALCLFLVLFSLYYLSMILLKGLPDDRNSILGFVSSNYCAAIIYINYPFLIYNLNDKTSNKMKKNILISIILSLFVILLSGSRTAIGVLIIILIYSLMMKSTLTNFLKKIVVFVCILLFVLILYQKSPEIREVIDRSLNILNGSQEVKTDVRSVVWEYTWNYYQGFHNILGSGSIIIDLYQRPAHNFILEIYSFSGIAGVITYITCLIFTIKNICKINSKDDFYFYVCSFFIFAFIAYVQPFFSTGFTCGFLFWSNLIVFQKMRRYS